MRASLRGEMVVWVEGEKDADNGTEHLGLITTTCPMGAKQWKPHYAGLLTGARVVILVGGHQAQESDAGACAQPPPREVGRRACSGHGAKDPLYAPQGALASRLGWPHSPQRRGERFEALYVLAITTGLRRGELLGLHWKDVDLESGVLRVGRALVREGGSYRLGETKMKRGHWSIMLTSRVVSVLSSQRKCQLVDIMKFARH